MCKAKVPWIEKPGFTITCCNDGLRAVIFPIERAESGDVDTIERAENEGM